MCREIARSRKKERITWRRKLAEKVSRNEGEFTGRRSIQKEGKMGSTRKSLEAPSLINKSTYPTWNEFYPFASSALSSAFLILYTHFRGIILGVHVSNPLLCNTVSTGGEDMISLSAFCLRFGFPESSLFEAQSCFVTFSLDIALFCYGICYFGFGYVIVAFSVCF